LLLENRHASVEEGHAPFAEKITWKLWKRGMLSRALMNMAGGKLKTRLVNGMIRGWKETRGPLHFPPKSFNEAWKERNR
jgi:L-lactate dehydrogenase complex protein LldF